jgi:hypothetical protein
MTNLNQACLAQKPKTWEEPLQNAIRVDQFLWTTPAASYFSNYITVPATPKHCKANTISSDSQQEVECELKPIAPTTEFSQNLKSKTVPKAKDKY